MEIIKNANPDGTFIETVVFEENGIMYSILKSVWDEQEAKQGTLGTEFAGN